MNKRGGIASPSFTSPVTSPPTSPRGGQGCDAGADGGVELTVVKGGRLYSNFVYLNPLDAKALTLPTKPAGLPHNTYLLINLHLYLFKPSETVRQGTIEMNDFQRRSVYVSLNEKVICRPFATKNKEAVFLSGLKLEIDFLYAGSKGVDSAFQSGEITEALLTQFENHFFTRNQLVAMDVKGNTLKFKVTDLELARLGNEDAAAGVSAKHRASTVRGVLMKQTGIELVPVMGSALKLVTVSSGGGSSAVMPEIFKPSWSFEQIGIGGLDDQLSDIFRRAFAPRVLPRNVTQELGIDPVRGILLHGAPGCGKTLIAKKLAKVLKSKKPIYVKGPEIFDPLVGRAEEKIRELFAPALADYRKLGDDSELHVVIMDEIDSIAAKRGMRQGGTGVDERVVTQLLSILDGVEDMNNILVIGMTNRIDIIDPAILRPGRLEIHVEIGLPDEKGRLQILEIHTTRMRQAKRLAADVDLKTLALQTKNFTGAELSSLVKNASAFACSREINDPINQDQGMAKANPIVNAKDFDKAFDQTEPAFGRSGQSFKNCMRNGIIHFSPAFTEVMEDARLFVQQTVTSSHTNLVSVLLEGEPGCGKTAVAAMLALESGFPFVKLLSPKDFVTYNDVARCQLINNTFLDAHKSPLSVIVIDDIERFLNYSPVGHRYSNEILQALLVLIRKEPANENKKLLILGTTSKHDVLEALELSQMFDSVLRLPTITKGEEMARVLAEIEGYSEADIKEITQLHKEGQAVPVRKLFLVAERALQESRGKGKSVVECFFKCMLDYGLRR